MNIFNADVYEDSNSDWVLYIDLDMIITGSLDDLVNCIGSSVTSFATLTTEDIYCETV